MMKKTTNYSYITDGINPCTWTQQEFDELRSLVEMKGLINQASKPEITYEKNDGKRLTKSAGYIPVNRQVEILQDAGKRLELMREGTYDYQDENYSFDLTDPTRRLNFDMVDADELRKATDKQIKAQQREAYLNRIKKLSELHNKNLTPEVSIGDNINEKDIAKKPEKIPEVKT